MSKIFIFYTTVFYLSYFLINNWKFLNNKLLDKETSKVQSFHEISTSYEEAEEGSWIRKNGAIWKGFGES